MNEPRSPEYFSASLQYLFPKVESFLKSETDFQFLVAILLSAQMTDEGVNKATKPFFKVMKNPLDAVKMGEQKIYQFVKSVNYAPTKARHIFQTAEKILREFSGNIPKTREELITLPGVGKKTAGVFLLQKGYDFAFPVDTHISRVSRAFGFTRHTQPDNIEADLQNIFPREEWNPLHLRMILYGRHYLTARNIPENVSCAWDNLEDLVGRDGSA